MMANYSETENKRKGWFRYIVARPATCHGIGGFALLAEGDYSHPNPTPTHRHALDVTRRGSLAKRGTRNSVLGMPPEFKSHRSYWNFAASVSRRWRFFRRDADDGFLAAIKQSLGSRVDVLRKGLPLWRAQLGHDWRPHQVAEDEYEDMPAALEPFRMKPLRDRAPEGRVNAKGIPCLYLATHADTAVAETRPWIGAHVSLARFALKRELRIVNCTTDEKAAYIYFEEPSAAEREQENWRHIDSAFAEPVTRSDDQSEYVPTQVLAEFFRSEGFDGVGYRSAVGPGHNVARFDVDAADLELCRLVQIGKLSIKYDDCDNPYWISKKKAKAKSKSKPKPKK